MVEKNYLDIVYENLGLKSGDYTHLLAKYIVKRIIKLNNNSGKSAKLLDVGAGKGIQAAVFSKYFKISTLDQHDDAKKILEELGIDCEVKFGNLENTSFPFDDNTFDYVFTKSVIEHIKNWEHFLSEIRRILKPNGTIIVMTPDWHSQQKNFYDDPTHIVPYTYRTLDRVLRMTNFSEINVQKIYQLPFTWENKILRIIPWFIKKLPDRFKWKDKKQRNQRVLVRFSKEMMLLASAKKLD
tara:strand:+ start:4471 stop:5190 length:720 start_codon:yes stop_codon:yes gene_type:complete